MVSPSSLGLSPPGDGISYLRYANKDEATIPIIAANHLNYQRLMGRPIPQDAKKAQTAPTKLLECISPLKIKEFGCAVTSEGIPVPVKRSSGETIQQPLPDGQREKSDVASAPAWRKARCVPGQYQQTASGAALRTDLTAELLPTSTDPP